jgi:hypothetical protein
MSLIATENKRLSNVVKAELWPEMGFTRQVVVINDTAADLKVGTVLGKVTATGKYKVAVETATDGSKVADAILLQDVTLPNATDTKVLVLVKGPAIVAKGALVLHSSYDTQAKKDAVYDALEAKNINVHDSV